MKDGTQTAPGSSMSMIRLHRFFFLSDCCLQILERTLKARTILKPVVDKWIYQLSISCIEPRDLPTMNPR